MATTVRGAGVTIGALARALTEQMLQVRRVYLKRRAPKSTYVHQLRRDIACGKARPNEMVLTIGLADIEDGASLPLVLAWYDSAKAILTEAYERKQQQRAGHIGAILPLVQDEARAEGELRQAENELLVHPDSPDAEARVESAAAVREAKQDRLVAEVRVRRARRIVGNAVGARC